MKPTPSLWQIILLLAILVGLIWQVGLLNPIWHEGIWERVRYRQASNPVRNRERWQRRRARWLRQEPLKKKQKRRSCKAQVVVPSYPFLFQASVSTKEQKETAGKGYAAS
jgi:hypothetical protein